MSTLDESFDAAVRAVAPDHDLTPAALRASLRRVNGAVDDYPGVHDLVYEYRRAFRFDPLLDRDGGTYYLAVPDRVWPEFADRAELSETELAACRAAHARVLRAALGERALDGYPVSTDPLVLTA